MIIIGIDPGTATTGFGVIQTTTPKHLPQNRNEKPKVIDFGCIITHPSGTAEQRLRIIHSEIEKLITKHQPDILSVESLYFFSKI